MPTTHFIVRVNYPHCLPLTLFPAPHCMTWITNFPIDNFIMAPLFSENLGAFPPLLIIPTPIINYRWEQPLSEIQIMEYIKVITNMNASLLNWSSPISSSSSSSAARLGWNLMERKMCVRIIFTGNDIKVPMKATYTWKEKIVKDSYSTVWW